jgi:hypothetical protein
MGYYISTPSSYFKLRKDNINKFFNLVSNLMSDESVEKYGNGGSWHKEGKTASWFAWVNTDAVRRAVMDRDFRLVFEEWGYETNHKEESDVILCELNIRQGSAKIGDEEKFFAAIASVVEDGSFIDVVGEDGSKWRWMWEGGKFFSQDVIRTELHFSEPNEIVF